MTDLSSRWNDFICLSAFSPSLVRSWPPLGAADAHVPYISRVILHTAFGVRALVYIQYGFLCKLLSLRSDLFWGIDTKVPKQELFCTYGVRFISDIYSCLSFSPSASEFSQFWVRSLAETHLTYQQFPRLFIHTRVLKPNRVYRSIKRRRATVTLSITRSALLRSFALFAAPPPFVLQVLICR